ncbi:hypothetical protein [Streptomyces sp. G1]|uniref:hypothetical protein n=1 Tax=Streptomyces sp. G1 TaxID=361572 RepID=UPI00202F3A79|nr:hypothetical protein [Streptomyces sp. G1]MCM1964897.1 hypothetical protein [Streptomyces sp. G1]
MSETRWSLKDGALMGTRSVCPEASGGPVEDGRLRTVGECAPDCGTVLVPARPRRPGDRPGHPGADLVGECGECGTPTVLMIGGAFAGCRRVTAEAEDGAAVPAQAGEPGEVL